MGEVKEKRCIICGKLLIDEKIPVCLRCKLEKRDMAGKITMIAGGLALASGGTKIVGEQSKNGKV